MKNKVIISLILLLIVSVVVIFMVIVAEQERKVAKIREISQRRNLAGKQISPPMTDNKEELSKFALFKHDELKFTIEYPRNWIIKNPLIEREKGVVLEPAEEPNNNISITYYNKPSDMGFKATSLQDYIQSSVYADMATTTKFKGNNAFIAEYEACSDCGWNTRLIRLFIENNGHIYEIVYDDDPKYIDAIKRIVESLSFNQ